MNTNNLNDDEFDDFYSGRSNSRLPLPKGSSDRKTEDIHFRISSKDKEYIYAKAARLGITVSEFLTLAARHYGKSRKK